MSSAVVSAEAALGRHFAFARKGVLDLLAQHLSAEPRLAGVTPASRLEVRPAPEMVSSGIAEIDALTGGLPRGCLTEICGPASSGRTSLLLTVLAAATRRGEVCAVVDASDALDPQSAAAAGVELNRLLWVRCGENPPLRRRSANSLGASAAESGAVSKFSKSNQFPQSNREELRKDNTRKSEEHRVEQVLRATDLLLESGGFGLVAMDLGDISLRAACRIPLTSWFRFRRAVEHTPTILLAIEHQPIAGSCSSLLVKLHAADAGQSRERSPAGNCQHSEESPSGPAHAQLLEGVEITVELVRSRLERKPPRSATAAFSTRTAWAG